MSKSKVLKFTKKDILEAARAKALSYISPAKKEKPLTSRQKKALAIHEAVSAIAECQTEPVLKLMDLLTGLPVSKAKSESIAAGISEPSREWVKRRPFMPLWGIGGNKVFLALPTGDMLFYERDKIEIDVRLIGGQFRLATKGETKEFFKNLLFKNLPKERLGYLIAGLIDA